MSVEIRRRPVSFTLAPPGWRVVLVPPGHRDGEPVSVAALVAWVLVEEYELYVDNDTLHSTGFALSGARSIEAGWLSEAGLITSSTADHDDVNVLAVQVLTPDQADPAGAQPWQ